MRNYETAIDATNTALDSAGSAARENARYMDSMEGKLEALASAWENFSRKIIDSDWLKKGMDVLTNVLEALSSDVGQAIIKYGLLFASVATGLNLIVKAGTALKGLSLIKFFSGIGKGAKGATDGLKIMQAAQVGATKTATPLYGIFGKLTGSLLGSAGLVAGIGLLSVALAKYVPIGEKARDIKLGKELEEAQSDVEKTEKKYKSLRDELEKLHEKEKEGTLTDSEQNRLNILENQTKQYERQLELKKQIAENKADEYYHTVDPSKLEGKAKDKYTLAKSAGKSDKEALAAAGVNDKIALSLNNVRARADEVAKAQEKVTEAYEHHGKESKQYKSALEDLDKAEKKQGDALTTLEKKRKKAIEDYGSEKKANKALGDSWKELNKEIGSLKALKSLNFKKPSKDIANLKKNAKNLGLEFDKSGKKINKIDLKTFSQKMTEAGYSVEDTWTYIKQLSKENPNIKVNIDGTETAAQDLEFVDGKIQKIEKEKPKAVVTVDAKDNASAKMKKIKADKNLGKAQKKLEEKGGNKVQSTMGKLTNRKSLGKANKKITQTGGDKVSSKMNSLSGKTSLGTATKTIKFSLSGAVSAAKKFFGFKKGIRHFASGGQNDEFSIFPNAEVNEQGFEIIQDAKTGFMRVANGGKRGTTHLNRGDTVYTHGQSVRILKDAGLSEGEAIYGHQNEDFGLFGVKKLPKFAKGSKPLTQKQYNTKYKSITSAYDKALEKLEYQKERYHWSEKTFIKKYKELKEKYTKKVKALNKKKTKKGVEKWTSLGTSRTRAYNLARSSQLHDAAIGDISEYIEGNRMSYSQLSDVLKKITAARKESKISAEEAEQYRKEAYKKNLEYNIKLYENNKNSFTTSLKLLKKYYDDARLTAEEYYQYREELAKTQLEKEKARLSEQQSLNQDTYSLAKGYVQRQINLLEKENEEQSQQNELIELQNNLAKVRSQRIRIYKEGEGFVYEQDTDAIREATEALRGYQSTAENPVLSQWKRVLELFDQYEADAELKAFENRVGYTVGQLFGSLGTDTNAWAKWIKNNLSTTQGLQDVLNSMDKLVDADDILNYLNSNGKVSDAIIQAAIDNNILPTTYASAITQGAINAQASLGGSINLATQRSMSTIVGGVASGEVSTQYGNIYHFDSLVLPNVTNASQFINELDNLSTSALQVSTQRM